MIPFRRFLLGNPGDFSRGKGYPSAAPKLIQRLTAGYESSAPYRCHPHRPVRALRASTGYRGHHLTAGVLIGISKLTGAGCPQNVCEMLAGHSAAGVQGQVYVHRESIPLSLLSDGLERLKYEGVVKELQEALEKIKLPSL